MTWYVSRGMRAWAERMEHAPVGTLRIEDALPGQTTWMGIPLTVCDPAFLPPGTIYVTATAYDDDGNEHLRVTKIVNIGEGSES